MAALAAIGGALTTAISVLWKANETKNSRRIEQLETSVVHLSAKADECERDRANMREEIGRLDERTKRAQKGV